MIETNINSNMRNNKLVYI